MPFKIPCQELTWLIAEAIHQGDYAEANSLEKLYVQQCGGKKADRSQLVVPVGASVTAKLINGTAFMSLINEQGNRVTVIVGGADGELITISPNGVITKVPPEGPGDPEIRQAITSLTRALSVLNGITVAGSATS